jgi:hypothetical protein
MAGQDRSRRRARGAAIAAMLTLVVPVAVASPAAQSASGASVHAVVVWDVNAQTAISDVAAQQPAQVTGRSFAMVSGAVYDAVNAIAGTPYQPYLVAPRARGFESTDAAAGAAAHRVLQELFPQQQRLKTQYEQWLAGIPDGRAKRSSTILSAACTMGPRYSSALPAGFPDDLLRRLLSRPVVSRDLEVPDVHEVAAPHEQVHEVPQYALPVLVGLPCRDALLQDVLGRSQLAHGEPRPWHRAAELHQLFLVRDDAWDDELQLRDCSVVRPDGPEVVAGEGSLRERIDLAQVVKVDNSVGHLSHAEQLCYGPRQSGLPGPRRPMKNQHIDVTHRRTLTTAPGALNEFPAGAESSDSTPNRPGERGDPHPGTDGSTSCGSTPHHPA